MPAACTGLHCSQPTCMQQLSIIMVSNLILGYSSATSLQQRRNSPSPSFLEERDASTLVAGGEMGGSRRPPGEPGRNTGPAQTAHKPPSEGREFLGWDRGAQLCCSKGTTMQQKEGSKFQALGSVGLVGGASSLLNGWEGIKMNAVLL